MLGQLDASGQHRHQGLRDQERCNQGHDDCGCDVRQENGDVGLGAEHDRQKDDYSRRRSRDNRDPYLFNASQGGFERPIRVHAPVSKHVLDHDDGIVDEHADRQHQAHHGQNVQTQSGEIQRTQGDQQGKRHGSSNDQGSR